MKKYPKINYNILGISNEQPKWNYEYFNELKKCDCFKLKGANQ